jgi:ankyrin repeat protein
MSNSVVSEEQFILDYFNSKYNITCSNIHDEIKRNEFNVEYKTLLYIACEKGDYDICKLLISNNADVNNLSTISTYLYMKKVSALYAACEYANRSNNDISIVKLLLDVDNIDVNIGDLNPLGYCCEYDNVKIAKLLLKHKNIDVNKKVSAFDLDTCLTVSCKQGNKQLIELLLNNDNLDINKRGMNGNTGLIEICRNLEQNYNYDHNDNYDEIANILLNHPKIDINARNHYGETVLHIAVMKNNIPLIKSLIKTKKINLDTSDGRGYTPLNIAVNYGFTKICELLVKNKCDVDLSDYDCLQGKFESILRSGKK